MMFGMRLQKIMGITVVLALLTAVAAGLSVLNAQNFRSLADVDDDITLRYRARLWQLSGWPSRARAS